MNYRVYYKDLNNPVWGDYQEFENADPWVSRENAALFIRQIVEKEDCRGKKLEIMILYYFPDKPNHEYLIGTFNLIDGKLIQNTDYLQVELPNLNDEVDHLQERTKSAKGFRIHEGYGLYPLGI
jgi:hypothetical protein